MQPRTSTLLTLALLACPACAHEEDGDDLEYRTTSIGGGTGPGTVFNTNQIDDTDFSDLVAQPGEMGLSLRSVALSDGTEIEQLKVVGSELVLLGADKEAHQGEALLESLWKLRVNMWLTNRNMMLYEYELIDGVPHYGFLHEAGTNWTSNCGPDGIPTKHPQLARLLPGFHLDEDSGALTPASDAIFIACRNGAVGKAASWGYFDAGSELAVSDLELGGATADKPALDEVAVDELVFGGELIGEPVDVEVLDVDPLERFELAIRVVRADYCYDGVSWTKPGTPLMVEDVWDIRGPGDPEADIEAVWGADGLLCVGTLRSGEPLPDCLVGLPECSQDEQLADYPDGLFMTRLP